MELEEGKIEGEESSHDIVLGRQNYKRHKKEQRERDTKVHVRNIEEGKWRKLIIH